MKRTFIFCHGFGFCADFWQNLAPYFAGEDCIYLDLGYFWSEKKVELPQLGTKNMIGIGHSLGFMKLISSEIPFRSLIGLQGFVSFLGQHAVLRAKRQQELQNLIQHFSKSPHHTLRRFYHRCGYPIDDERLKQANIERLSHDLKAMDKMVSIPPHLATLMIGSTDDVVVPPELLIEQFGNHPQCQLDMLSSGQHSLGYLAAELVYHTITKFIDRIP